MKTWEFKAILMGFIFFILFFGPIVFGPQLSGLNVDGTKIGIVIFTIFYIGSIIHLIKHEDK